MLKRLFNSISAIFAGQFLGVASNLALVPLFLSRWSTGTYGEWMALSAVVSYFGVTDLGMNSAAANAMTAAYARGEMARYRHLQGSAMAFYIWLAAGLSFLVGALTFLFPIPAWIGVRHISPATAAWVTWLLAARLLWQMPAGQLGSVFRSIGNLAASQWFGNLLTVTLAAVMAAVLLFWGGVLELAWCSCLPLVIVTGCAWLSLRRQHPELLPSLSEASINGLRELLRPSLFFGVIMLSMALTLQGPVLLVSRRFGGAAVALLVTTRTLANVVRQVIATLQSALWPELTRLSAIGSDAALQLGHRVLAIASVALCAAFAGALWFEGGSVITAWTRGKLPPDIWLLRFLLLALVLQAPWLAGSIFSVASNMHRRLAYSYFVSATLTLIAIFLLLPRCGLIAVPLGAIIGEMLASYHFVISDVCHVLNQNYVKYASRIWPGVAIISIASWSAGWIGHAIARGPVILRCLEVGSLTTAAAASTAWILVMERSDRDCLDRWRQNRRGMLPVRSSELTASSGLQQDC